MMRKKQRINFRALTFFITVGTLLLIFGSASHAFTLWGDLPPGPYAIGFKTIEKYDFLRPVGPVLDYFGKPLDGERSRPIQICIWYPAKATLETMRMVYGEYAFPYPEDDSFINALSELQNRENGYLFRQFNNNRGMVLDVMSLEMGAVRDAPPWEGSFPLIAYHPHLNSGVGDNAVLCEYLASHGFIVAATHSLGTTTLNAEPNAGDLEAFIRDLEFVVANVQELPHLDLNKFGALGSGFGGSAALLLQSRSFGIGAVASLCGSFVDSRYLESTSGNPYFSPERLHAPLLQAYCVQESTLDLSLFESLTYSERYSLAINEMHPADLSTYGLMSATRPDSAGPAPETVNANYQAICLYVANFFKAHLKDDEQGRQFIQNTPEENGINPNLLQTQALPGQGILPTPDQFQYILREYGVDKAVELYYEFKALDSGLVFFREAEMNVLGYQHLQSNQVNEAIELFKMNADAYPASANVWDSLADGYRANNDEEHATECYKKLLEVLPHDTGASEQLKETLRNNAEQYLEQSGGETN